KDIVEFSEKEYLNLYNGEPFLYYEDINKEELNSTVLPKYLMKKDGIKSFFTCYFMEQGEIKGYIGLESYNTSIMLKNDDIEGAFVVCRLIGGQILKDKTEKKFDTENQINQAIVSNQQLYTYIVRADTFEVLYLNDKFKNIIPNINIGEVCYKAKGYDYPCHECPIKKAVGEVDTNTSKFYCEFVDNWLGVTSTKIKWIDKTDAYLVCYKDISEYIEQINYIDSLTGAPTLNKFNIYAKNILNNIKNKETNCSILYMDIDKFKYINDTFGYSKGDEVLKEFAIFLNNVLEDNDIFCRASDDIFISLIKYKDEENFLQKINYIYDNLEKMQKTLFNNMN
ncbi:MAG: GGDEF domain-containing protein, partial [Eubacteriales bacterium]|nr:GGDEF domain-containing protein [Eubacteriales bacterium]